MLDLISPPPGAPLLSALGDIDGFRHDRPHDAARAMFNTPSFGTRTSLDFAELSPGVIVRVGNSTGGQPDRQPRRLLVRTAARTGFQASSEPGGVSGAGTIAAAANASRVVWTPGGRGAAGLDRQRQLAGRRRPAFPTGAIVESDRVNPLKFYGFANGTFYVSTNGGATLRRDGAPPACRRRPGAVQGGAGPRGRTSGSPAAARTATYGLWHSTDTGATFARAAERAGGGQHRLRQGRPGQTLSRALHERAGRRRPRHLPLDGHRRDAGTRINDDQHQYALDGRRHHRRPARLRARVPVARTAAGSSTASPAPPCRTSRSPRTPRRSSVARGASVHQHDHDHPHRRLHRQRGVQRDRPAHRA